MARHFSQGSQAGFTFLNPSSSGVCFVLLPHTRILYVYINAMTFLKLLPRDIPGL